METGPGGTVAQKTSTRKAPNNLQGRALVAEFSLVACSEIKIEAQ
jgi:hypothetical protein